MSLANPIGVSCQINPPDFARLIRTGQPRAVLLMPPFGNVDSALFVRQWSGHSRIILRWNGARDGDEDYRKNPLVWCAPAYEYFAPFRDVGALDAVVLLNESQVDANTRAQEIENAKWLNDWHVGAAAFFNARHIACGAYSFSRGTPKTRKHNGDLETWSYMHDGAAACQYLFVHEYTYPRYGDGIDFWEHRYRALWNELPPDARRPIGITECLHDGGGIPDGLQGPLPNGGGWAAEQYHLMPHEVIADLKSYATALATDNATPGMPLIDFAVPFVYGAAGSFSAFDLGREDIREQFINEFLPWSPDVPPQPPIEHPTPSASASPSHSWSPSASPEPPTGEDMPYDPQQFARAVFAFPRKAYALQLGAPLHESEIDYTQIEPDGSETLMRYRVYQKGALVCEVGDWGNILLVDPLTGEEITVPVPSASVSASPSAAPDDGVPPYVFPPVFRAAGFVGKEGTPLVGETFYRIAPQGTVRMGVSAFCDVTVLTSVNAGATRFVFAAPGSEHLAREPLNVAYLLGADATDAERIAFTAHIQSLRAAEMINTGVHATVFEGAMRTGFVPAIGVAVVALRADGKGEIVETDGSGRVRFYFGPGSAFTPPTVPPYRIFIAKNPVRDDETKLVSFEAVLSDETYVGDTNGTHTEIYMQLLGHEETAP